MRDEFVLLERKVIDPSNAITFLKFGRMMAKQSGCMAKVSSKSDTENKRHHDFLA